MIKTQEGGGGGGRLRGAAASNGIYMAFKRFIFVYGHLRLSQKAI